jgi:mono/diheme cytochrome c family protein
MPRERPKPPPFEPEELERGLDRYLTVGLVFMVLLLVGFATYKLREPSLREDARVAQEQSYQAIGQELFDKNCSSCHGKGADGGSAPTLNAKEFLSTTTDQQMQLLIAGGVSGSDMQAWGLDSGGTLTDEQIRQLTTYLRSLEENAPSVPSWRRGK